MNALLAGMSMMLGKTALPLMPQALLMSLVDHSPREITRGKSHGADGTFRNDRASRLPGR